MFLWSPDIFHGWDFHRSCVNTDIQPGSSIPVPAQDHQGRGGQN